MCISVVVCQKDHKDTDESNNATSDPSVNSSSHTLLTKPDRIVGLEITHTKKKRQVNENLFGVHFNDEDYTTRWLLFSSVCAGQ